MAMTDEEFAAFLEGTELPEGTFTLYKRDRRTDVERLNRDLSTALRDAKYADEPQRKAKEKAAAKVAADLADAIADMEQAGAVVVRFRAMTADEYEAWISDDKTSWPERLAVQSVDPALSADQWRKMGDRFGSAQVLRLAEQALKLTQDSVVVPGLSAAASAILAGGGSKKN